MPQYMLSVMHDGTENFAAMTPEEMQPMFDSVDAFNETVRQAGKWVFAGGLEPIESSTTVDGSGESPVFTDGPYSESKEYLGGYWVIEADDLDDALAWAGRGSKACGAIVEVRPFNSAP